ncbi:MAG: VOC family protein [Elusimicrobia bacterium]|nr:VOC family protein [Elusimicrobiota bacterium]
MKIEHVAMWTKDLAKSRRFYERYFGFKAGKKYHNKKTGFTSCFLSGDGGSRLELMHMGHIPANRNSVQEQHIGWIHVAVAVGGEKKVLDITEKLRKDGFAVVDKPRRTGDGCFESCVLDPDRNRIEVTIGRARSV